MHWQSRHLPQETAACFAQQSAAVCKQAAQLLPLRCGQMAHQAPPPPQRMLDLCKLVLATWKHGCLI